MDFGGGVGGDVRADVGEREGADVVDVIRGQPHMDVGHVAQLRHGGLADPVGVIEGCQHDRDAGVFEGAGHFEEFAQRGFVRPVRVVDDEQD